ETSYMYTDEKAEKVVDVKEGCKLTDIDQAAQNGVKPLFKPPGIFQNNGAAAAVDGVEQDNAGLLGDAGSLKCLHGSPGSTGNPLPTGDQIGQMNKPVID